MLMVLSPAKSLDMESRPGTTRSTEPVLLEESAALVRKARTLSAAKLGELMSISADLAKLNRQRFRDWEPPFTAKNAQPAIYAFTGDVYQGLDVRTLKGPDLTFAQKHLRILSGLYGVLRPLDLIQAYRLEMGSKLAVGTHKNLYEFWGDTITDVLHGAMHKAGTDVLVNLASQEYFKSLRPKRLEARIINCAFKERKGGKLRLVSFYAKRARGMMARYIIEHRLTDPEQLRGFDVDGYRYDKDESRPDALVFARDAA